MATLLRPESVQARYQPLTKTVVLWHIHSDRDKCDAGGQNVVRPETQFLMIEQKDSTD